MRFRMTGAVLLFGLAAFAAGQESKLKSSEVPAAVLAAAQKQYPGAKLTGWSKETEDGKTTYEASVVDGSSKKDAVYSGDGSLVAVEEVMAVSDLPDVFKNAIYAKYPKATLRKAEKITSGSGELSYEIGLAKAPKKEILLGADGKIMKEE